ncbi:hypothetical protein GCM10025857_31970 [Alicyclobacillus contaminans]|nr:hypothetical protein GCM10025857_31970 [Alicyclobacillus contaminans]
MVHAKSELIRWLKPTGTLVLNRDDRNTRLVDKGRFHGKILTIGITHTADYQATNVAFAGSGMTFHVHLHGKREHFRIPILGMHHVYNALCAIAIADDIGILGGGNAPGAPKLPTHAPPDDDVSVSEPPHAHRRQLQFESARGQSCH